MQAKPAGIESHIRIRPRLTIAPLGLEPRLDHYDMTKKILLQLAGEIRLTRRTVEIKEGLREDRFIRELCGEVTIQTLSAGNTNRTNILVSSVNSSVLC